MCALHGAIPHGEGGNVQPESKSAVVRFLANNHLTLLTAIAVGVLTFLILEWSTMPTTQRLVALFFLAITLHEWEETKYPGGFIELMAGKMGVDPHVPKTALLGVDAYILVVVGIPLFFPGVGWMFMAPMFLGLFEAFMHTAGIKLFHRRPPYTPGLATAVLAMLPISVYGIWYAVSNDLLALWEWPMALLYMAAGFAIMQSTIIHSIGLTYPEAIKKITGRSNPAAT
jgi:hypothetical protein